MPLAVDFTPAERLFAEYHPEAIEELEQCVRDGLMTRDEALTMFRRLDELAEGVLAGDFTEAVGAQVAIDLAINARDGRKAN